MLHLNCVCIVFLYFLWTISPFLTSLFIIFLFCYEVITFQIFYIYLFFPNSNNTFCIYASFTFRLSILVSESFFRVHVSCIYFYVLCRKSFTSSSFHHFHHSYILTYLSTHVRIIFFLFLSLNSAFSSAFTFFLPRKVKLCSHSCLKIRHGKIVDIFWLLTIVQYHFSVIFLIPLYPQMFSYCFKCNLTFFILAS